ncbi:hypothetical protein OK351_15085 [Glutamicibacter sp. MNS18]|nr:hypothetical protein [Glutamicibacter sp. MNS18]
MQDDDEEGIEGVVLKLIGPDGKEVLDIYGNPVGPTTTDKDGYYVFENLPPLGEGEFYTVVIDKEGSQEALEGYVPTKETEGNREKDSSTWEAKSENLTDDGDHDGTLDFGFVLPDEEPEPEPTDPVEPEPSESTDPAPSESTDPVEPEPSESTPEPTSSEDPTKAPEQKEEGELVNTGFAALSILLLGSLLAAAGVSITRRNRRRHG